MKKQILIVDDEANILTILSHALSSVGYRVTVASLAHEAVRIAKIDPPQLAIVDLQLKDSDGFELIQQLKELFPQVPVILLTGVIFDADVIERAIKSKVACYLEKTAPLQQVVTTVQRLLGESDANPTVTEG